MYIPSSPVGQFSVSTTVRANRSETERPLAPDRGGGEVGYTHTTNEMRVDHTLDGVNHFIVTKTNSHFEVVDHRVMIGTVPIVYINNVNELQMQCARII